MTLTFQKKIPFLGSLMVFILLLSTTNAVGSQAPNTLTLDQVPDPIQEDLQVTFGTQNLLAVDWSSTGNTIAFGGSSHLLYVTDDTLSSLWNSSDLGDQISDVHFSPNGEIIAASTYNDGTFFFNASTGSVLKTASKSAYSISWSPDGTYIAIQDQIYEYSDLTSPVIDLIGHDYIELEIAWHPFSSLVATAAGDSTVRIWDTDTGKNVATIQNNYHWIDELSWSPQGHGLVFGVRNGDVVFYDNLMSEATHWFNFSSNIEDISWSPDGQILAVGQPNDIYLGRSDTYAIDDWEKSPTFTKELVDLAWSPTSDNIVSVHWQGVVKLWSVYPTSIEPIESTSPSPSTIYTHENYTRDIQQIGNYLYFSQSSGAADDGEIFRLNLNTNDVTSYLNVTLSDIGGFWAGSFHIYENGVHDIVYIAEGNTAGADVYTITLGNNGPINDWSLIETTGDAYDVVYLGCDTLLYTDFSDSVYINQGEEDSVLWKFINLRPMSISFNSEYGDFFVGDYSARTGEVGIMRMRNGGFTTYNPGYTGMATDNFYEDMYLTDAVNSYTIDIATVSSNSLSSVSPPIRDSNICSRTDTVTVSTNVTITETSNNTITSISNQTLTETTTQITSGNDTGTSDTSDTGEDLPISAVNYPGFVIAIPLALIPILVRKKRQL